MSKVQHKIAIVLVNYQNLADTIECINSIYSGSVLPFIVLIDNASGNAEVVESEIAFYPFIKHLPSRVNLGFAKANNLGFNWIFENLNTEYIFVLNNDTVIERHTLETLVASIQQSEKSVAVAAPLIKVFSDRHSVWYGGGEINYLKMVPEIIQESSRENTFTGFASGCAGLFKTDVLKQLGGFDPFYFMYDEDVELSIHLRSLGFKILFVPAAVIYHKCQGSQTKEKSLNPNQLHPSHPALLFYLRNTIPNRKYTISKHLKGYLKFKAQMAQTIYWLGKSFQFTLYGKFEASFTTLKFLFIKSTRV